MSKPERRRSSLTGSSPVIPGPIAPQRTPERVSSESTSKHKLSIYQDPQDTARLRAAYRRSMSTSADRSFSAFVSRLLMTAVEQMEAEQNGGRRFDGLGAGEIPTGRPVEGLGG